jgi:sirohydrochlorin ferrochelatase
MNRLLQVIFSSLLVLLASSCADSANASGNAPDRSDEVAVLLVNHGSHSPRWRQGLLDLEANVTSDLLAVDGVTEVRTAFMEYTEPSIATQLQAIDELGYGRVVLVPIFLTVSSHSFDDIPTIIGQRTEAFSKANLSSENIKCYTPKAKVVIAPLLDFADVMRQNLGRRIRSLSRNAAEEGVVLVAYGSEPYNAEWVDFMDEIRGDLREDLGIESMEFAFCGHIAQYSPEPTAQAIERVLEVKSRALVMPVLVAVDEDFQFAMILEAAERTYPGGEVAYIPDSILPDPLIEDWVLEITRQLSQP